MHKTGKCQKLNTVNLLSCGRRIKRPWPLGDHGLKVLALLGTNGAQVASLQSLILRRAM
jgi:hypothetical protein